MVSYITTSVKSRGERGPCRGCPRLDAANLHPVSSDPDIQCPGPRVIARFSGPDTSSHQSPIAQVRNGTPAAREH